MPARVDAPEGMVPPDGEGMPMGGLRASHRAPELTSDDTRSESREKPMSFSDSLKKVAVLGAGTMGSGIAQVFSQIPNGQHL